MKKLIALLLSLLLMFSIALPLSSLAEAYAHAPVDLTPIVIGIALLVVGVIAFFSPKIARFLDTHNLRDAAEIAVRSAEALWGRYKGEEKLSTALNILKNKGYDVKLPKVLDAIRVAWQMLDVDQRMAGIKTANNDGEPQAWK